MLEILSFLIGVAIVVYVVETAVRTVVLPRASRPSLSAGVFSAVVATMKFAASRRKRYENQDAVLSAIAPVGLLTIAISWIVLVLIGFAFMFWATDPDMGVGGAFALSGSSITTLGFVPAVTVPQQILAFTEAILGLLLLTLLISYLPSIYSGFQRREQKVALLEVRAGNPPSAAVMLSRFHAIGWLNEMSTEWLTWEVWFAELEESHTTHTSLPWFRSNDPKRSWVTSAGAVLDAAAVFTSSVDGLPRSDHAAAGLTIRAGFISLRRIAQSEGIPFDPDPEPTDPITIQRSEFDEVLDGLAADGVPIIADRDQAWRDFAGWRVNYDNAILGLAQTLRVPYAPWTSDRYPLEMRRSGQKSGTP
ncbi:MAG: hypothetical protein ACR2NG_02965 [Acidimicrobiia bacterium]